MEDLAESATDVDGPPVTDLQASFNQLIETIEQIGQGGSDLPSILQAIQAALSQFATTLNSFINAYSCD
jgi:hypothetical protein